MFVVMIRYPDAAATEPHRTAHQAHIRAAVARGEILVSGPMEPRVGGIIIATATTRAAVDALIAADPYHRAGVATYELVEFQAFNGSVPELLVRR